MLRCLRYLQMFQGKNPWKNLPIDIRSEITDIVILVRNFWISCRVQRKRNMAFVKCTYTNLSWKFWRRKWEKCTQLKMELFCKALDIGKKFWAPWPNPGSATGDRVWKGGKISLWRVTLRKKFRRFVGTVLIFYQFPRLGAFATCHLRDLWISEPSLLEKFKHSSDILYVIVIV